MNHILNLLELAVIGSADGPTNIVTSGDLPLPAFTLIALVIILMAYTYISKAVRGKKAPAAPEQPSTPEVTKSETPIAQNGLELVGTDEKTAAIIMAIVSEKSGIPLNRLSFKSIKLMEDK